MKGMGREVRSQSAMEYLMTYGWAILIIAVVLGALYSLGVFNMSAYMPKVGAGACHVFRPNGPGTSWNVALTGSCSGYLPQYVAQFTTATVSIPLNSFPTGTGNPYSVFLWVNFQSFPVYGYFMRIPYTCSSVDSWSTLALSQTTLIFDGCNDNPGITTLQTGKWYFVGFTYNGGTSVISYVNNKNYSVTLANSLTISMAETSIGTTDSASLIANFQIYNTSLTADQVQYLYNEGIGGAPIYLQHLVGWWPINGDTLDYSGNNNNGGSTTIAYNGSWTSGYYH